MLERFVAALLGFYLGFSTFFSFVVAPILFSVLDKSQGGKVVFHIFPLYFGSATLLLGLAAILTFKGGYRKIAYLLLVATLIAAFQEFYILPSMGELKTANPEGFKMWHGISMLLNGVDMLIAAVGLFYLIKEPRGGVSKQQ